MLDAQNIKRAYKSLEKQEYDKAKEAFLKILAEDSKNVGANFGMALIEADDKSPLFDIIDAWKYVIAIKGHENELSQDDIEVIGEYFMNTEVRKTSRPVKKKIQIAEDAVDARLIKYIREENNLEAVYKVLELYPDYDHRDNVMHIRNQFEFRKYEKLNTLTGYEEFIKKFPDAAQAPKAMKYCDKLAFDEIKTKNSVQAYNDYIKAHPKSNYVQQAKKLRNATAFAEAKKINTLVAYNNFIDSYPDALEIPDARKQQRELMYQKAKRIKSLEAYNEFIRMYPDGAYYIDVFNLKAGDLGMQNYRQLGFDSPDLIWSEALDNNEQAEEASSIAATHDGGYIIAGTSRPDSGYSDAWIVKLDAEGKMVWNKTVGQAYNDQVKKVLVTSGNDVVVVGYTQVSSDSSALGGWMFKLNSDGKKLWNKSLGEISIASCGIDPTDKIYLATYIEDTIPDNYYFQIFNADGKMTGERDYSQKGTFNDMKFTPDGHYFFAGSRWFNFADNKFYISWEDTLRVSGTIQKADLNNQSVAFVAMDSVKGYNFMYSITGNKIWQNSFPLTDSTEKIEQLILTDNNQLIELGNNSLFSYACKYDGKGNLLNEKKISGNYKFVDAVKTSIGVVYLLKGDDYLVISFASPGF